MKSAQSDLSFCVVNAFSLGPFTGNPAGVVIGAQDLTAEQMQRIARQFNLVETVFVTDLDSAGSRATLRYFTPGKELPIAGHPTIAAFSALRRLKLLSSREKAVLSLPMGDLDILFEGDRVLMEQLGASELPGKPDRRVVADLFGLTTDDLMDTLPIECFDLGLGHLIVPLNDLNALMRAKRDTPRLAAFCQLNGVREAQLFCFETKSRQADLHTRNIAPHYGLEDPACGNGNAALGAFVLKHCVEFQGRTLRCEQGHVVSMPSLITVLRRQNSRAQERIFIGGDTWRGIEGRVHEATAA